MFEAGKEELIEYCFGSMISTPNRLKILDSLSCGVRTKSLSLPNAAARLRAEKDFTVRYASLVSAMRANWVATDKAFHFGNLASGVLDGHGWHGVVPSALHRSLQDRVREVCTGTLELSELIEIGADIARHEYFMVATHDLLESELIAQIDDAIPSIANRGVSDFAFNEIPFDLKTGGIPRQWSVKQIADDPVAYAQAMYDGADSQRLRKQAEASINNWGVNRFYVNVADESRWGSDPQGVLDQFIAECRALGELLSIQAGGVSASCYVLTL